MAIFYFVAIVNYQSDKEHELNLGLERRVEDRTRQLKQKNTELEDAFENDFPWDLACLVVFFIYERNRSV
jgi:hypothetical protein